MYPFFTGNEKVTVDVLDDKHNLHRSWTDYKHPITTRVNGKLTNVWYKVEPPMSAKDIENNFTIDKDKVKLSNRLHQALDASLIKNELDEFNKLIDLCVKHVNSVSIHLGLTIWKLADTVKYEKADLKKLFNAHYTRSTELVKEKNVVPSVEDIFL
ncbi:hypothetical protein [Pseudomonas aeruginosa]|uniref:hypothetical protein n=1 Tax=Pseudomonas aeruginosa TaxID=287 RepID=UPI001CA5448D|nr:hypothetical protein [Pseudomonas aeruginosa]MBW6072062.1 hypothetical protein [Pseudomonas aeruginosa]